MQSVYQRVVGGETELPTGFQALFAIPVVASRLVDLDDLVSSQAGLEP